MLVGDFILLQFIAVGFHHLLRIPFLTSDALEFAAVKILNLIPPISPKQKLYNA